MLSEPWTTSRTTDSLGRTFEWLQLLGKGGFGEVYLALMRSPTGLEQHVAVKLLPAGLAPDTRSVVRLRDEARLLASLRHPVVLAPHDLAEIGGRVALVTEFVEGDDLSACIDDSDPSPLPESTLLEVVEQVASALEMAWNQLRVVHRDVKPENIRIGRHGNVKLLDFGLASSDVADRAVRTSGDRVVGTMRYFAPERFDPRRDPTPASDVFALGCILYQGIVRAHLLAERSLPEVVQLFSAPDRWDRFVEEQLAVIPSTELRALLVRLLAHDAAVRPSAGEVRERCEALRVADPSAVPLSRWCRDRHWRDAIHADDVAAHLAADRLASASVTSDEQAHLASCLSCRTARRLLLTEWSLGRYRILGRIGRGGMSDVYAAILDEEGQRCALKVLRDRRPGLERRFAREAEMLRSVDNVHVLPLLDMFDHEAGPVLVLPFVEGPTLAALLEKHRLPRDVAGAWFAAIVDGVAALHGAGMVHRDLKPANVLLDPASGVVVPKLTDLGLARDLDEASGLTRSGMVLGTPAYIAPEQLLSAKTAGPRADVWSLGVLLVELLTNERVREPPPDLPAPWREIAALLLQPDPNLRPADATAVAALLPSSSQVGNEWVARCRELIPPIEPAGTDRPRATFESPLESSSAPPVRSRRIGTATLGLAIALLAAAIVVVFASLRPVSDAPLPVAAIVPSEPAPIAAEVTPDVEQPIAIAPPPAPAPLSRAPAPPVSVWVKTRPWGHVTVGTQRWSTEDRSMRIPPGRQVLKLESHDGRYRAEVELDVVAGRENRLCWDFPTGAPCSH